jgi:hypothetical protein
MMGHVSSHRLGRLALVVLAYTWLPTACVNKPKEFIPPVPVDGGLPERRLMDSQPVKPDTAASDGVTDGGPGTGAEAGTDALSGVMTVTIESPMAGSIHRITDSFRPLVTVVLTLPDVQGSADTVTEVTASVDNDGTKGKGPSAALTQAGLERTPETNISTHRFLDTPVDISMLPSAEYELTVVAKTLNNLRATAKVKFFVDRGPNIAIRTPVEKAYYRASAPVDVTITEPLSISRPLKSVGMTIGQTTLVPKQGPGADQYSATILFKDYNPTLQGDQVLTVRAINNNGTVSEVRRRFVADDEGPVITSTIPAVGSLIGNVITISAVVKDPAGVLASSVVAVVAHGDMTFEVKLPPRTGAMASADTYEALFDTTKLPVRAIFPSISFRASDLLGNESSVGYLVSLDNGPPMSDLDPPAGVRLQRKVGDDYECSHVFDPLGNDAVSDLRTVSQLFDIRARIQDDGNHPAGGADFIPIAGINDQAVQLLILDDTTQPLVVDTTGDGVCDAVNPLLTPTTTPTSSRDALAINMVPVPPAGAANYTDDLSLPNRKVNPPRTQSNPDYLACGSPGTDPKPPESLCATTNLSVAIYYTGAKLPAIYALPPITNDDAQCVGRQFDALGNHIQDGWICLAVQAADTLGNVQVSRPIRVCISKDGGPCPASAGPPPSCSGTQVAAGPPPTIDGTKPCRPWSSFPTYEVRFIK